MDGRSNMVEYAIKRKYLEIIRINMVKSGFLSMYRFIHKHQEIIVDVIIYISYLLYLLTFLGLSSQAPNTLNTLNFYFRLYICLFLILRFNPFLTFGKFTNLDRKISFSAGIFILTSNYLPYLLDDLRKL